VSTSDVKSPITVRCSFCDTKNRVDFSRASDRSRCGECSRPILLDRPVKVTQEDFDDTVLKASVPVLVDFYADWCGPCKMVAPLMDELAQEHIGKILVAKVDTDRAPEIAAKYGIRSIPTLIVFRNGTEVERSMGFEPDRLRTLAEEAAA
jgi:thioredoxin 2